MEYLILFYEYLRIKKWSFLKFLGIAIILGFLIYKCSPNEIYIKHSKDFHNNIITILGVLIGFSISVFTVLLTVDNKNIQDAKLTKIDIIVFKRSISLYESVIIGLAYVIILQGFLLIANYLYPLFIDIESLKSKKWFSVNISLSIYIIFLLLRNVLDFYLIITRKDD